MKVKRYEIWLVALSPTKGSEIAKTRPCVVISPNEMNNLLNTIIVAPLTHSIKNYPTRVKSIINNEVGEIVLDQIRAVDKEEKFVKKLGEIDVKTAYILSERLVEMFRY
jgi:mRNA interferase MazF